MITVKQLSDCPEYLETVADWIYSAFWSRRHPNSSVVRSWLTAHVVTCSVPFTIVAFVDGEPAGSCCVIENDCVHRPQYAPWLAAVFVRPEFRGRGVATTFLTEAKRVAKLNGISALYIDCLHTTAPLYERSGWSILEREVGDAESVVMKLSL